MLFFVAASTAASVRCGKPRVADESRWQRETLCGLSAATSVSALRTNEEGKSTFSTHAMLYESDPS